MKKFYAFIAAILFAGSMMAAELTISPSDITAAENTAISFSKDGLKLSISTGTVTNEEIRVFKNQTLTLKAGKITKVVFTCTKEGTTKYGPGCFGEQEGYSYEGATGTWEGEAASVEFTASGNQVRATSIVVTYEPAEAPEPINVTIHAGLQYSDATEEQGWWQMAGYNEEQTLYFTLSNAGSVEAAPGTYTAANLDASYSYIVTDFENITKITFTSGSIELAEDEFGGVSIKGSLEGIDENIYVFDLYYIEPKAETEETVTVEDAAFYDMTETLGIWGFIGTSAEGVYVQLLFAGEEAAPGNYTEEDFDMQNYGAYLKVDGNYIDIYTAEISVVANEDGSITVTAELLCYNNTLYHVTMTVPADEEQGIENVVLTEKAQKVVVDGAVYVIRDNKLFNIVGARVR